MARLIEPHVTAHTTPQSSASRASPGPAPACSPPSTSVTAGDDACSGVTRAGLRAVESAQALMSGAELNDAAARIPIRFMSAHSLMLLPYGVGGHSRFFSS